MADKILRVQDERPQKRRRIAKPAVSEKTSDAPSDPIKRATRACDQCRTQKKRCDSGRPCNQCIKASLDCSFGKQARKRGFPTGYVRLIEALWALVFRVVPGSQETALHLLRYSSVAYDEEGKVTLVNFNFDKVNSSRKAWLNSSVRQEIEKLASGFEDHERTKIIPEWDTPRVESPFPSNFGTWSIPEDIVGRRLICKHGNTLAAPTNIQTVYTQRANVTVDNDDIDTELSASLPINAWNLTEMYFKFSHSWLPILPKHNVVRMLTEFQDGAKCSSGQRSVLWALFSLVSVHQHCREENGSSVSDRYYDQAMKAIPNENNNLEPNHLIALVQLIVTNIAKGAWETASLVLRRTIRDILQLQRSYHNQQKFAAMESILGRIALATFCMDTLVAARLGTIPQLRSCDISWATKYDENESDEWDQWSTGSAIQNGHSGNPIAYRPLRVLSTFKQYVKLMMILNDSLCDIRPTKVYEGTTNNCRAKISSWKAQLPKYCQRPITPPAGAITNVLPSVANLHLTADAVSRYLFSRPAILTDNGTQKLTIDEDESAFASRKLYQESFGSATWYGILNFQEYAQNLCNHGNMSQNFASGEDNRVYMDQSNYPETAKNSAVMHPQGDLARIEMANSATEAEFFSGRISIRDYDQTWQREMDEGLFSDDIDDLVTSQIAKPVPIEQNNMDIAESLSGANAAFESSCTNQHAAYETSNACNDPSHENSIETLLEELSSQQDVSWGEMEAQCRYNLGFLSTDPMIQ